MPRRSILDFTQEDIDDVFHEIWLKEVLGNSNFPEPVSDPKAFVFGGPPGAGKSSSMNKVATEYLDSNTLIISGDDYRRYHPNFEKILEKYGDEWSLKTSKWSAAIYERVFQKATQEKYNIQIEGTFRDKKIVLATLDKLKVKGYTVNIAVVAASRALSEESIKERYEQQKAAGQTPRAISPKYLSEYYPRFSKNVEDIYKAQEHNIFVVFQREKGKPVEKIFDSTTSKEPLTKKFIDKVINDHSRSFGIGIY